MINFLDTKFPDHIEMRVTRERKDEHGNWNAVLQLRNERYYGHVVSFAVSAETMNTVPFPQDIAQSIVDELLLNFP